MQKNSGFTLFEVMIATALIAILAAIALPNMITWRSGAKLRGAAENIRGDLNLAKTIAVRENAFVVVNFFSNRYEVFVDNGANAENWIWEADELRLRNRDLPAGVTINVAASTFANDRTRYNNRGLPENIGTVVIVNSAGEQRQIQMNLLGNVTIQ